MKLSNEPNGASELARLDAKVLSLKIENLGKLLTGGDSGSVVAAIEAIEAFGFKAKPDGEVWRKAEAIRCVSVLDEASKQRASSQWVEVLSKLDFVKRLHKEFSLDLPSPALKTMGELETWGRSEFEKDRREREFKGLLADHHRDGGRFDH